MLHVTLPFLHSGGLCCCSFKWKVGTPAPCWEKKDTHTKTCSSSSSGSWASLSYFIRSGGKVPDILSSSIFLQPALSTVLFFFFSSSFLMTFPPFLLPSLYFVDLPEKRKSLLSASVSDQCRQTWYSPVVDVYTQQTLIRPYRHPRERITWTTNEDLQHILSFFDSDIIQV